MSFDPLTVPRHAPLPPLLVWWSDRAVLAGVVATMALAAGRLDGLPGAMVALGVLTGGVLLTDLWLLLRQDRSRRTRRPTLDPATDESRMWVRLHRRSGLAPLTRDERPLARRLAWQALVLEVPAAWRALSSLQVGFWPTAGWGSVWTVVWWVLAVMILAVQVRATVRAARWRSVVGDPSAVVGPAQQHPGDGEDRPDPGSPR